MPKKKLEAPVQYPQVDCCHQGCSNPAILKLKTNYGWANLCKKHYELYFTIRAEQTCQRLGLNSIEQRKAWVRENARNFVKRYQTDRVT